MQTIRLLSDRQVSGRPAGGFPSMLPMGRPFAKAQQDTQFELRRRSLIRLGRRKPLARVASLLLAISRNNSCEGRDPNLVPDALTSGFIADLLGVSVARLADLLVELASHGLVQASPAGLRLLNIGALESLVDAH